jgi:hypothetical protein
MEAGNIGGTIWTLDDIENRLRSITTQASDYLFHTAIVGAAVGCPDLRNEAYDGSTLDQQTLENFRSFMTNEQRGMRVNRDAHSIQLSTLFKVFESDFKSQSCASDSSDCTVLDFVLLFLEHNSSDYQYVMQNKKSLSVTFIDYDWRVNAFDGAVPCHGTDRPCYKLWAVVVTVFVIVGLALAIGLFIFIHRRRAARNMNGYDRITEEEIETSIEKKVKKEKETDKKKGKEKR